MPFNSNSTPWVMASKLKPLSSMEAINATTEGFFTRFFLSFFPSSIRYAIPYWIAKVYQQASNFDSTPKRELTIGGV